MLRNEFTLTVNKTVRLNEGSTIPKVATIAEANK